MHERLSVNALCFPGHPMEDIVRSSIPARYNTNSELKATLVAGRNEVNFDLKRDGKK